MSRKATKKFLNTPNPHTKKSPMDYSRIGGAINKQRQIDTYQKILDCLLVHEGQWLTREELVKLSRVKLTPKYVGEALNGKRAFPIEEHIPTGYQLEKQHRTPNGIIGNYGIPYFRLIKKDDSHQNQSSNQDSQSS